MSTKLTLRLDENLIQAAKIYAQQQGKSLSQVVADYFKLLTQNNGSSPITAPITSSLVGLINPDSIDEKDYKDYLEDKYL